MIKTIEIIIGIILALAIAYALIKGAREIKKAKETKARIVDVETVVINLKEMIAQLEKRAANGYSEAETQLNYYKDQLKQVETLQSKLTDTKDPI